MLKESINHSESHIIICTYNSLRNRTCTVYIFHSELFSGIRPVIAVDNITFIKRNTIFMKNASHAFDALLIGIMPFIAGKHIDLSKSMNISKMMSNIHKIRSYIIINAGKSRYFSACNNNRDFCTIFYMLKDSLRQGLVVYRFGSKNKTVKSFRSNKLINFVFNFYFSIILIIIINIGQNNNVSAIFFSLCQNTAEYLLLF